MEIRENINGKRFGQLLVIENGDCEKVKCLCDCGNTTIVSRYKLIYGHTKSCGCLRGHNRTIDLIGESLED